MFIKLILFMGASFLAHSIGNVTAAFVIGCASAMIADLIDAAMDK